MYLTLSHTNCSLKNTHIIPLYLPPPTSPVCEHASVLYVFISPCSHCSFPYYYSPAVITIVFATIDVCDATFSRYLHSFSFISCCALHFGLGRMNDWQSCPKSV